MNADCQLALFFLIVAGCGDMNDGEVYDDLGCGHVDSDDLGLCPAPYPFRRSTCHCCICVRFAGGAHPCLECREQELKARNKTFRPKTSHVQKHACAGSAHLAFPKDLTPSSE